MPVGGGLGKRFTLGGHRFAVSGHAYFNVIRPEGAPVGLFRFDIVIPVPLGGEKNP